MFRNLFFYNCTSITKFTINEKYCFSSVFVFSLLQLTFQVLKLLKNKQIKNNLQKGKQLVSNKQKLKLKKLILQKVKVNKVEVKNQKNKTRKKIRKNKYNSKSVTKNAKRENE